MDVTTIWPANLCCGSMLNTSSARPNKKIPVAQRNMGRKGNSRISSPAKYAARMQIIMYEANMLTPP
ncbi:MAG: hypothetical protein JSW15_08905, partial [Deltaproteobacteria bacterium]